MVGGRAYDFPRTPGISLNISRSADPHVLGDIARPPFRDNAFGKVYFECIPYDAVSGENLGALDQTMRILRPGGSRWRAHNGRTPCGGRPAPADLPAAR